MEKEDDYGSEERKAGVQTSGTPEGKIENRGYAAEEKDFFPGSSAAEAWHDNRNDSKKGFTEYLRFIWPYALLMAFLFSVFLIVGYNSAASFPSMAETLRESFSSRFESIMTMNPLIIMLTIFLNNAFLSLLFLVLGLALGILPVLFIAFNGYIVGVIVYLIAQERGLLFILLGLLPHGILELPMVFLAAGIGLRLGHQVFSALIGKPTQIKREFKEGLMFYFRWILPLLLVAAIIETFITPIILSLI
ncbi:stage II sporulation protein M [Methanosarcina sp. UBA5]|uniref:stage II sporulation protein M n=1 Tax=Methanosarcina sp. UBA5 TaxID=1915593 RepID=UPI0026015A5C|nr:stage II sporulation protein M [Methanosarcina sp. UBA5]